MTSPEPSENGGPPSKPDSFDMKLEPIDPTELNIGEIPTVVVAVVPRVESGLGTAILWCLLFLGLFAGIFNAAARIADGNYSASQKLYYGIALGMVSAVVVLAVVIYSACQKGFTYGKAFLWCLLFLLVTQGVPGLLTALAIIFAPALGIQVDAGDLNSSGVQRILMYVLPCGQILAASFSVLILRLIVGKDWKRKIGLHLPSLEHIVVVIIGIPALLVISIAVETIVARFVPSLSRFGMMPVEELVNGTGSWPWSLAVLTIGLGPAIGEELWCRGFLGQGLTSRYGRWGGVLLASFLFGSIHVEPPQAVMAFLMGIVLHLSYLATRSILVPMLIHFLNNSLIVLAQSNTGRLPVLTTLDDAYQFSPWLALSSALLVLVTVGVTLHRTRVRIFTPVGHEAPFLLYPHVETPVSTSVNRAVSESLPFPELCALIVSVGLFAAVWFGI